MRFKISYQKPLAHFLSIELAIDQVKEPFLEVQLPAWRPGRYELQHYAKNIRSIKVYNGLGKLLPLQKNETRLLAYRDAGSGCCTGGL